MIIAFFLGNIFGTALFSIVPTDVEDLVLSGAYHWIGGNREKHNNAELF